MTILNQTMIPDHIFPSPCWFLLALIPFVASIILAIIDSNDEHLSWGWMLSVLWVMCQGILWVTVFDTQIPSSRHRYEITIDKNYSAKDLLDQYNVINNRGEIWIIEDKQ